jgi:lipoprotein NlpI
MSARSEDRRLGSVWLALSIVALSSAAAAARGQESYLELAAQREAQGDLDGALVAYDRHLSAMGGDWRVHLRRGSLRFRLGRVSDALADFDRVVALAPVQEPYLWQRGIAQYYDGRFAECTAQFELHRRVNPNDVENAVWHLLCGARLSGLEAAREGLLPVGADRRVPMREVYALFAGTGSEEQVREAVEGAEGDGARAEASFYAELYLALFQEALGGVAPSLEQRARVLGPLEAAAATPLEGYMVDVARVHLALLRRAIEARPEPVADPLLTD